MLFNSYEFVLLFLPVTVLLYYQLGRRFGHRAAFGWLFVASCFFYGWWNPIYLPLLGGSILVNYWLGQTLTLRRQSLGRLDGTGFAVMWLGVALNVGVLGYFKYANFFVDNAVWLTGAAWHLEKIVLPLGISFFTFQKIAYLVDAAEGEAPSYDLLEFALFVMFFPQLIAGPIVHHGEIMPQFARPRRWHPRAIDIAVGATIFAIGLAKKAVLADGVARYATPVFAAAGPGSALGLFEAWGGALAYSMQLYFDFSGYSDMAIGGARLFGIRLPVNFNSPYKAVNIVDFWRRWHMTLSRFLRDYVYIALGGNQRGKARRYANLLATMVIGGFWHGAGWTFVIWGALHGIYLIVNHGWQALRTVLGFPPGRSGRLGRVLGRTVTFLAVVVGWVFFRANGADDALRLLAGMAGLNGASLPAGVVPLLGPGWPLLQALGVEASHGGGRVFVLTWAWVVSLMLIAFLAPNTQELLARYRPALNAAVAGGRPWWAWRPSPGWAMATAAVAAAGLLALSQVSEFLYFQF
jgi:alginate O-acetyltransferase complex protein AlgI